MVVILSAPSVRADDTYQFVTKWGGSGTADGQLDEPYDIELDAFGNMYVADSGNDRIQKFTGDGDFITKWGETDAWDGDTSDGRFSEPYGIAVDDSGEVWVVDRGYEAAGHVQKFTDDGTFISAWPERYYHIGWDIEVDPSNVVYVSYFDGIVRKYDVDGTYTGPNYLSGPGPTSPGFVLDPSGKLFATGTTEQCVKKFTQDGVVITNWGGQGSGEGQFDYPWGIALDVAGNVYVADENNHRIQKFTTDGDFITSWGSEGTGDGQFLSPWGITVDTAGNVYVTDRELDRVQKFAPVADVPPTVISIDPADGATNVATTTNVKVTFNEAMDRSSVESSFSLSTGSGPGIMGSFTWSSGDTVCTFDLSADLLLDTPYDVVIGTGARDAGGTGIASAFASEFSTGAATDVGSPYFTCISPEPCLTICTECQCVERTFEAAYDDDVGVTKVVICVDGHAVSSTRGEGLTGSCYHANLGVGSHCIVLTITDSAGNEAQQKWCVNVIMA